MIDSMHTKCGFVISMLITMISMSTSTMCTGEAQDPMTGKLWARQPDQTGDSVLQLTSSIGREKEEVMQERSLIGSPHNLLIEALSGRHIMVIMTANFVIYQVQFA